MTGAPVALSAPVVIGLGLAVIAAVAFIGGVVWLTLRGKPTKPDIPPAMRPGPADEVLERRQLERVMGWGVVFVMFFATWLPVYWLREPTTNVNEERELLARAIERGEKWFENFSPENPTGFGCERCHGPSGEGGQQVAFTPPGGELTFVQPPRLRDVCGGADYGHPLITTFQDIRDTIEQGRENTPMPSWSVRFQGAMNDQQISDLINYLVSIQDVPEEDNLCLLPPGAPAPTEATPAEGGSPTPEESP